MIPFLSFSQDRILSKKIVYDVDIMRSRIEQTKEKDSIAYDYIVDKRFFWQAVDTIFAKAKHKDFFFMTSFHESLSFDSIMKNLKRDYLFHFKDTLTDKKAQKLLEDEIRVIKFEEEWTYNPNTLMVNKTVIGYNPVIRIDSIKLQDDDLIPYEFFRFELGWIYPKGKPVLKDTLCLVRNIHFTLPIYNKTPYHWWDSHLEPEYSIPPVVRDLYSRTVLSYRFSIHKIFLLNKKLYICRKEIIMNKYRITYPNNKEVREYLLTLSLCKAKKSRTTKSL